LNANRSPAALPTGGGTYGEQAALDRAQAAVPVPSQAQAAPPAPLPAPGSLGSLHDPGNPDVPLTNGLPMGPGAGPEAIAMPANLDNLKALSDRNKAYIDFALRRDDLPPRVARFFRLLKNV